MLSRKVVTRSGRGFRGYFPSKKLNRMVHCESILERDAAILFENSALVLSFQEQPILINYSVGEEIKSYYPDFLLRLVDCSVLIEVKPSSVLTKPAITKKFNSIKKHFQDSSQNFLILDETVIKAENSIDQFHTLISSLQFKEGAANVEI